MACQRIESIWNLMSKYSFEVNDDRIKDDLTCLICKKLMIDAVLSIVCGCQYCYKCVAKYIDDGNKYCPGNKEFCNDESILLDINALKNTLLNKRILKLKVTCPNQACLCVVELMEMYDHLRLCSEPKIECPYLSICGDSDIANQNTLDSHQHCDNACHCELLKNDISVLKDEIARNKLEIKYHREESLKTEKKIASLEQKFLDAITEMEMKLKIEASKRERNLKEQIDGMKKATITMNDIKDDCDKCKLDIEYFKEELNYKEKEIVTLKEQLIQVNLEIETKACQETDIIKEIGDQNRHIEFENLTTTVNDLMNDVNKMKELRNRNDNDSQRRIIYWIKCNKLCPNIDEDFVWKIDTCTKKMDIDIYSESFYSNNYKLCLYMFIGSNSGNIYLYCYIMKGNNDDDLEWPMKRALTLSIVNQETLRAHKSDIFETAFNRPRRDTGGRVGTSSFIKYSTIKENASIIVSDSIIVSCVISDL